MDARTLLSSRLDTPWKRIAFVLSCLPLIGLAVAFIASGYFYYRVYIGDDYISAVCHEEVAWRELGLREQPRASSDEAWLMNRAANSRLNNRWSLETIRVEQGDAYKRCLMRTRLAGDLLNLQWALTEARNFAVLTVALPLVLWIGHLVGIRLLALLRWVAMR